MNALFLVALIAEALFGVGFILVPGPMLAPFGVTLNAVATSFARLFGSALIGLAVLLWFARRSDNPEFKKVTVYSLLAYYLTSTIVLVIAQLGGQMNAMGWVDVGIHTVLLVWFGYASLPGRLAPAR